MIYQNNNNIWCRKCYECGIEIPYKKEDDAFRAEQLETKCSICSQFGHIVTKETREKMSSTMKQHWELKKQGIVTDILFGGSVYLNSDGFWCRICPTCKKEVQHSRKDNAIDSFQKRRLCGSCAKSGSKNWSYKNGKSLSKRYRKPHVKKSKVRIETPSSVYLNKKKMWCRICPTCKQETEYTSRWCCIVAEKKQTDCSKCCYDRYTSPAENDFLNYMLVKDRQQSIQEFVVDGLDLNNRVIYEFLGDYWHGNPLLYDSNDVNRCNKKTFGQLYQETLQRFKSLRELGYSIYYVWEHDWKRFKKGTVSVPRVLTVH